jgi:hypothetical protein
MFSLEFLEKTPLGWKRRCFIFLLSLTLFVAKSPHLRRKHEERKIKSTQKIQTQVVNVNPFFIISPKKVIFSPDSGKVLPSLD